MHDNDPEVRSFDCRLIIAGLTCFRFWKERSTEISPNLSIRLLLPTKRMHRAGMSILLVHRKQMSKWEAVRLLILIWHSSCIGWQIDHWFSRGASVRDYQLPKGSACGFGRHREHHGLLHPWYCHGSFIGCQSKGRVTDSRGSGVWRWQVTLAPKLIRKMRSTEKSSRRKH